MRCVELNTPRGLRPGKLLVVRPLDKIEDFRQKKPADKMADFRQTEGFRGTLVVADVACLDAIEPAVDEYGMELPGFVAGHQFRNQVVFPGFLNKAFRGYVGQTLIGVTYLGPNTKGKPPILFRDLSGDQAAVSRGQRFLAARPEFLIPVVPEVAFTGPAAVQNGYVAPQQDVWAQPQVQPATMAAAAPAAYGQGDPWAQGSPVPHPAVQPPAQVSAPPQGRPMSTLDQLKQANAVNHQGQPQAEEPPF